MTKICTITNGNFTWRLEVDDQKIDFGSSSAAEYFEKHYTALGYTIVKKHEVMAYASPLSKLEVRDGWYGKQ